MGMIDAMARLLLIKEMRQAQAQGIDPGQPLQDFGAQARSLVLGCVSTLEHREMRALLVEILDPLQDHRIETGPDHELPLEPVAAREMTADFVGRQQVVQFDRRRAAGQAEIALLRRDLGHARDLDAGFAEPA